LLYIGNIISMKACRMRRIEPGSTAVIGKPAARPRAIASVAALLRRAIEKRNGAVMNRAP